MRVNGHLQVEGNLVVEGSTTGISPEALPTPQFTKKTGNTTVTSAGGEADLVGLTGISFPDNTATGNYLVSLQINTTTATSNDSDTITIRMYAGTAGDLGDGAAGRIYEESYEIADKYTRTRIVTVWRLLVTGMTTEDKIGVSIETTRDITVLGSASGEFCALEIEPI